MKKKCNKPESKRVTKHCLGGFFCSGGGKKKQFDKTEKFGLENTPGGNKRGGVEDNCKGKKKKNNHKNKSFRQGKKRSPLLFLTGQT